VRYILACDVSKSGNFISCFSLCWQKRSGNRKSAISCHYHDGVNVCGCIQPFSVVSIQPFPRSALPRGEYKDARGRVGSVLACNVSKNDNFVLCFSLRWQKHSGNRKSAISCHYHDGVNVCGCIQPFPADCPAPGGVERCQGQVGSMLA
jgi:hypothetical protein